MSDAPGAPPEVAILGGGPAGLGAAYRLHRLGRGRAIVVERGERVGGNAGSFPLEDIVVDFGSHRLHPETRPDILHDIRSLLGADLRERPRHGRIRLRGRWVHFPLKPLDLLLHLDPGFLGGAVRDAAVRSVRPGDSREAGSFGDALMDRLGPTICQNFYFPYARKIWGLEPEEMATEQAHRRVSANSPGKLVRKVLAQVPGLRARGGGRFFYPRKGFGQISEAYAAAASELGASVLLTTTATAVSAPDSSEGRWTIEVETGGERERLTADYLWSTVPLTVLARIARPEPPAAVLRAAAALDYRAMLLIYLELPVTRFTEYDAHYFPSADVSITRLSEPKNYAGVSEPSGRTVLCSELPCSPEDAHWKASDAELAEVVTADLERAGLPLSAAPTAVFVRRLRYAYPIYRRGYAPHFQALDAWSQTLPRFLSFGRQGLFAHDNTHHALAMAYAAVDCLTSTGFDTRRWSAYRAEFEKHVVVD